MRRAASLGILVVTLWSGMARAGGWQGYASASTGFVIDHLTGVRAKGGAVQGYLGVESPFGLSLGILGEGAETWGARIQGTRLELDYRSVGMELRLRLFRERPVSPWVGMRVARSWSSPLTLDDMGQLRRMMNDGFSTALRFGMDTWLGDHLGITVSTAWQWCDVRVDGSSPQVGGECTRPLHTIMAGPTLRF
jgi:hypothetical protein